MKIELTLKLIRQLRVEKKPIGIVGDRIVYQDNPSRSPYFLFDAASAAPTGFGIKVAEKLTFIVQRKVGGRTFRASLGSVAECFDKGGLEAIRARAAAMGAEIVNKGVNPNTAARSASAAEMTLGDAFRDYENYLTTRQNRPAKPATIKVFRRAMRKFADWHDMKIRVLSMDDIEQRFMAGMDKATSNEQAFRTAFSVVRRAIEKETLAAAAAMREPRLTANPFSIIQLSGLYRTRDVIEQARTEAMVRNPLSPSDTLGKFLEALWAKRLSRQNKVGCDYLLLTLLTGARRSECSKLQWVELLTEPERKTASWVDLEAGKVFFYQTKNGQDHLLPLGPCAIELLRRRQEEAAEMLETPEGTRAARKWVFPARNRASKAGHYMDAQDLLSRIRDIAKIPILTRHDLRRSFGSILVDLEAPDRIAQRFMNHNQGQTHNLYTRPEWEKMVGWMVKIEEAILIRGPNVWNSLKPSEKSPLPAQPLPEVPADKPRTGRPRKNAETGEGAAA